MTNSKIKKRRRARGFTKLLVNVQVLEHKKKN